MYRCFRNLNSFGLFFFYLMDFLLNLKQACHGFTSTATFATMALPQKGLQYGAAANTPMPCFCRDSKQYIAALFCQTTQTFRALTQKA